MLENASPPEIWYTIPSAIGLVMWAVLLFLSVRDEVHRRRAGVDGAVRLDVQKSIATAAALVVAQACLTQIGVNQMATPPNPNLLHDPITASTALMNATLFVVVDAALIALAGYRLLQRVAVGREIRAAERRDRRATDQPPPAPSQPAPPVP